MAPILEEDTVVYLSNLSATEDSTNNNFEVILNTPIVLPDSLEFEVALTRIQYPREILNINDGSISYFSPTLKKKRYNKLRVGYYDSAEKFLEAYKTTLGSDEPYYSLHYNTNSMLFFLDVKEENGRPWMKMSKNLSLFTGLPTEITGSGFHAGNPGECDIMTGNSSMYIVSSLSAHVHVGNRMDNVLSTITFGCGDHGKTHIQYEPRHLIYTALDYEREIRSIRISILNEKREPFPFRSGNVMCTLHIRPAIPKI